MRRPLRDPRTAAIARFCRYNAAASQAALRPFRPTRYRALAKFPEPEPYRHPNQLACLPPREWRPYAIFDKQEEHYDVCRCKIRSFVAVGSGRKALEAIRRIGSMSGVQEVHASKLG